MATYEEIQRLLEENRKSIGERAAEVPNIYNQYSPSTDPEIAGARAAQADKVRQLFDHDTNLAQVKFQPQTTPGSTVSGAPATTPSEMILDPLIGMKAANTETMQTANEAIDIGQSISKRKDYLSESLDKALKLFQIGMQIKQAEQAALQDEMSNWFKMEDLTLERNKVGKETAGKEALQKLLDNVLDWKKAQVESTPTISGRTTSKGNAGIKAIQKMMEDKYPGQEVEYTKNSDGTYNWTVRKSEQKFLTPEQAKTYEDPNTTLKELLSSFTSLYPENKEDAATILSGFEDTKETVFGTSADEYGAGVANKPRTTENEARYTKYIQWKNMSDFEKSKYGSIFENFLKQGTSDTGAILDTLNLPPGTTSNSSAGLDPLGIR